MYIFLLTLSYFFLLTLYTYIYLHPHISLFLHPLSICFCFHLSSFSPSIYLLNHPLYLFLLALTTVSLHFHLLYSHSLYYPSLSLSSISPFLNTLFHSPSLPPHPVQIFYLTLSYLFPVPCFICILTLNISSSSPSIYLPSFPSLFLLSPHPLLSLPPLYISSSSPSIYLLSVPSLFFLTLSIYFFLALSISSFLPSLFLIILSSLSPHLVYLVFI